MNHESLFAPWVTGIDRAFWQGSIAIACVWGVNRFVLNRASPSVRSAMWWIACLKCLFAFGVAAVIALPLLAPSASRPNGLAGNTVANRAGFAPILSVETVADRASRNEAPPDDRNSEIAFALWTLGVAAVGGWTLVQTYKLRVILRRSSSLQGSPLGKTARVLGAQMGIDAPPRIAESAVIGTPIVVGLWRPTIVVPYDLSSRLDPAELRMVIAHELAHVKRKDLFTGLVPALCQHLLFFLPPVWLAVRGWTLESEAACDAEALRATQEAPPDYAQMLMKVVAQDSRGAVMGSALGATNSYRTLQKRFEMMKSFSIPSSRARYSGVLFVAVCALLALPWKVTARPPVPGSIQAHPASTDLRTGGSAGILCHVLSADGKPMAGVTVFGQHNRDRRRFDGAIGIETDANGEAKFQVSMSDLKYESFNASIDDQFSDPSVRPIDGVAVIRLRRVQLGSLRGIVRDENGKPLADARVFVTFDGTLPFQGNLNILGERATGADGSYRFDGLYPGIPVSVGLKVKKGPYLSTAPVKTVGGKTHQLPDLRRPGP